jgi:hypothetical protein
VYLANYARHIIKNHYLLRPEEQLGSAKIRLLSSRCKKILERIRYAKPGEIVVRFEGTNNLATP